MSATCRALSRVVIVPGNGCDDIHSANWYSWLANQIQQRLNGFINTKGDRENGSEKNNHNGVEIGLHSMPDPLRARRTVWLPVLRGEVEGMTEMNCVDPGTIAIGHSSGAVALMRLMEEEGRKRQQNSEASEETQSPFGAVILVSAYVTDLGDRLESQSGYFDEEWDFEAMRAARPRYGVFQFGAEDDPFLPIEEQDEVADGIGATYMRHQSSDGRGHFMTRKFPELLDLCLKLLTAEEEG